jgi:sirohydrochlorin cobaltochelatase
LTQGIVLFAHGSRDAQWARPFEQLALSLSRRFSGPVELAFLDLMPPTLEQAIDALARKGVLSVRVVPVFLGKGGHVGADLPRLAAQAAGKHPTLKVELEPPIGEQATVIEAIASAIAAGR